MIKLTILSGPDAGSVLTFESRSVVIGRGSNCDVILHDTSASRRHCSVEQQGSGWVVTDLQSGNGVFVNDLANRVATAVLKSHDELILGKTRIQVEFHALSHEYAATTVRPTETSAATPQLGTTQAGVARSTALSGRDDSLIAVRPPDVPIVVTVVHGPDRGLVYSPPVEVFSIGRVDTCNIVLHDSRVSRLHATIKREGGKYRLYDENSANGTFLHTPSNRIFQSDLADGDTIYLGQTQLRIEIPLGTVAHAPSEGEATLISGTVGGKNFTFTLAALGSRARGVGAEEATQLAQPESPAVEITPVAQLESPAVETTPLPQPESQMAEQEDATRIAPPPTKSEPRLTLRAIDGKDVGATFELPPGATRVTIGRGEQADWQLHDRGISRIHCVIEVTPAGFFLIDEGSLNGTFLNKSTERISRVALQGGEEIYFSETRLKVEIAGLPKAAVPEESTVFVAAPQPVATPATAVPAAEGAAEEKPTTEDVQSRSVAFKERLETITQQKGFALRPFTMPGTPRQWASLALMLIAAVSSYGFLSSGHPLTFSGGPVAEGHARWENQCVTCHPSWGWQPVNATCVTSECHAKVLKTQENVQDDCVSCHSEHRGRAFNIKGGEEECWRCHEAGLGVRRFEARPLWRYYQQIVVASGAMTSKSGTVTNPLQLQPPTTEAARRAWQQSLPHVETGLKYGHAVHENDVKEAKYQTGVACVDCHKQLPEGQISAFPTHAECIDCHKEVVNRDPQVAKASAGEQCLKCHTQQEGGITRVQRDITYVRFSHDDHEQTRCESCHFIVQDEKEYRPVLRAAAYYPLPMNACYDCHEKRKATVACLDCHREHHSYPTTTEVAGGWLDALPLSSVLLVFVALVAGAGTYTYFDTRLARRWLASVQPSPSSEPVVEASPAPAADGAPAPTPSDSGILPFPTVDAATCISCSSCYDSCPTNVLEGDRVTHKSIVVNPSACKALEGCTICQDGCPTGAIRVTLAPLVREVERAQIDEHNESNVPGIFLVGEVIGAALIKKAVNQGDQAVRYINVRKPRVAEAPYDVIIIGAGPAGLGAGLEAKRAGLRYLILERGSIASTIQDYPRDKAVLAEPVLLPQYGLLPMKDDKKESLIAAWIEVIQKNKLEVHEREEALVVKKTNGLFTVTTPKGSYDGSYVLLAIGTRGNPRKIGVKGEDLSKVAYNLIDAADFKGQKVLVVGGGDSAIEAAVALSKEPDTTVTLSYRRGEFSRIKSRNAQAIEEQEKAGRVTVIFNSSVTEISEKTVTLKVGDEVRTLENDAVFALIGADPPKAWLEKAGVKIVTVQETVGPQW